MTKQQLLIMGDNQILCVSLHDVIGRTKHQSYAKELNQNLSRTLNYWSTENIGSCNETLLLSHFSRV